MNHINRAVVKQQAKDIIKGRIFYLFLITLIVSILANMSLGYRNLDISGNDFELFRKNDNSSSESYNNDSYSQWSNPIEDFEFNSAVSVPEVTDLSVTNALSPIKAAFGYNGMGISVLVGLIFLPLTVTLSGMYLSLVRRKPEEEFSFGTELGGIFKNTFNDTYLKKLLTVLFRGLITVALTILFIVPGLIFNYSAYFANEIMSDNPNLKPMEAIKLSKKMVKGSRTELFVLDLSFMAWFLLCIITLGIATVYVLPYYNTTKALYYENFRMRALQYGVITADDFVSFDEKVSQYNPSNMDNSAAANNYYSYANPNDKRAGEYYYSPKAEDQPNSVNAENSQPDRNEDPQPPQESGEYTPPQDNAE